MPRKTGAQAAGYDGFIAASMRPRPDAAENSRTNGRMTPCSRGFNEAAARCRGKRFVDPDAALYVIKLQ